jgi:hypothetical protein
MTAYSAHFRQDPAPSIVQPRATITPAAPTIMRRASIETPLAPKVAVGQNGGDAPIGDAPAEFDLNLELDVPAFLRRNE